MLKKLNNIVRGWANYLWESNDIKILAEKRALECACCPSALYGKVLDFLPDDVKEIEGMYCDLCTCPLSSLLRSPDSKCKANRW